MATTDVYNVKGMTCGHCVSAVRSEVGGIEGVRSVDVDTATGRVTVVSARRLDYPRVAAAVDEAGFELVGRDR